MSRRVKDIEPRAVRWLWRDRIPQGMLSVVAGKPSAGKSLFTLAMAAELSEEHDILVAASEDPAHEVVRPRLEAVGADLHRVHIANRFWLPSGLDYIAAQVKEHDVRLVVIDPIADHLDLGVNRRTDSIRKVTEPLAALAESTGAAVVLVEHALKGVSKNADPLSAIAGGSSGLVAAARVAYIGGIDPNDNERVILCNVKPLGPRAKPLAFAIDTVEFTGSDGRLGSTGALVFEGELDGFEVMSLLAKPSHDKAGRPPTVREEAAEFIARYLLAAEDHSAPSKDLLEDGKRHGHTEKTMRRAAADSLGISTATKHMWEDASRVWWWRLPDSIAAAMSDEASDG